MGLVGSGNVKERSYTAGLQVTDDPPISITTKMGRLGCINIGYLLSKEKMPAKYGTPYVLDSKTSILSFTRILTKRSG
jgi:hypothetical protein